MILKRLKAPGALFFSLSGLPDVNKGYCPPLSLAVSGLEIEQKWTLAVFEGPVLTWPVDIWKALILFVSRIQCPFTRLEIETDCDSLRPGY